MAVYKSNKLSEMIKLYLDRIRRGLICLGQIREESGKGNFRILSDYYYLHRTIQIGFYEYYKFEFEKQPAKFRNTFLSSKNKRKFLAVLNPRKYYILARNKYLTHLILESAAIAKPVLFCYYSPKSKIANNRIGYDCNSVLKILKEQNVSSCFIKTTETSQGEGVMLIDSIDYKDNSCRLFSYKGEVLEFANILKNEPLIFESVVEQSAQFKKFNSSSVNTVRFMTTLQPSGEAKVIAAFLKIGRNGACVDNAGNGGNVDTAVDIETGELHSAITFNGWRRTSPIKSHPDTGTLLDGVTIENWHHIKSQVLQFQQAVPFLRAIGWDIAITDLGPVVIEINDFWDETGQLFIKQGWRQDIENCYKAWINHVKSVKP
jgi:hypothetical protein